ncbi:uncharacterized protein LOC142523894 [Primulina tabacum]|uniref:uncharacterized protein LOC142523894 n=1 Tax=Primulina tabacum TaxID=48773 RepID=UPI003F5A15C1
MDNMTSSALFHVIDAKTSMLLGRPWLHENGVVPSTWHQCFKYSRDGVVKKVLGDERPFTEAESHFADAKYYFEIKKTKIEEDVPSQEPKKQEDETSVVPKSQSKCELPLQKMDPLILPLTKLDSFICPTQGIEVEHGDYSELQSVKGFDPKAYKLLVKAGYNPKENLALGKLPSVVSDKQRHGLTTTPKMLKENGYLVQKNRTGLGFVPPSPVRIAIKRVGINYTAEDGFSSTNNACYEKQRVSVFDRLGRCKRWKGKSNNHKKLNTSNHLREANKQQDLGRLRSLIPSRMKRHTTSIISRDKFLKAKIKTVVYTRVRKNEDDIQSVASCINMDCNIHHDISQKIEVQPLKQTLRIMLDIAQINNVENVMKKYETLMNIEHLYEDLATTCHITSKEGEAPLEEDAETALPELERGVKATIDELKEINLGSLDGPRPIYLSASLSIDEKEAYVKLLHEYEDIFAWSYKEIPGLDPKMAQRRFRPELIPVIENDVNKLIEVGFISEVKYPTWISSIVPVRKKNGQLRICVEFRDLNEACPKDDFPLPITELMIDATMGHEALSFMDGSSNAGATYQRAMQRIFDDMLHKSVECYVDDVVVKSINRKRHLKDLKEIFERMRKYQLKMNPLKCAFGVTSGKFLGFIV